MPTHPCVHCGTQTPNSYRLCDECRQADSAALRPKITDPADVAFSSRMLLGGRRPAAKRTKRRVA